MIAHFVFLVPPPSTHIDNRADRPAAGVLVLNLVPNLGQVILNLAPVARVPAPAPPPSLQRKMTACSRYGILPRDRDSGTG